MQVWIFHGSTILRGGCPASLNEWHGSKFRIAHSIAFFFHFNSPHDI